MAGSDQPGRLRAWNALAITLTVLYAAGLVLFCYSALTTTPSPSGYAITQRPFSAYSDPRAWWPIALQLALGIAAFGAYYIPRQNETRSFSLLITGGLGVSTIVLGVCSVWNCTELESPFFTPLAIALGLLLGSAPTFVGACATGQPYPLALQLARLLGPLLLVITALGIVATLFRAQLDRLVVRFARSLVVVVGLSQEAIPVLRRLAGDLPRRTVLAVLVPDADHPLTKLTRDIGARVVGCDLEDEGAIRVLVLRNNRFKVQGLFVISDDIPANLGWARTFRDIADSSGRQDTDPPPRITARIDDPWQAEYWRRTNAYRTPAAGRAKSVRWVSDALSRYEVTAAILVAHVQSEPTTGWPWWAAPRWPWPSAPNWPSGSGRVRCWDPGRRPPSVSWCWSGPPPATCTISTGSARSASATRRRPARSPSSWPSPPSLAWPPCWPTTRPLR